MRTNRVWFAALCAALGAVLSVGGCNKKTTVVKSDTDVNVNVTNPGPVGNLESVMVTASIAKITLGACPADITFQARAYGTSVSQTFEWKSEGGGKFVSSGDSAKLTIDRAGIYKVIATTSQHGKTMSGEAMVEAVGNCGGDPGPGPSPGPGPTPPPPPPPTPPAPVPGQVLASIDYAPRGGDVQVDRTQEVQASCWDQNNQQMACPFDLVWESSNNSVFTVAKTSNIAAVLTARAVGTSRVTVLVASNRSINKGYDWRGVAAPPPSTPATCPISANPTSVSQGGITTLSWSSVNATSASASASPSHSSWSGGVALSGAVQVTLNQTTTFTINCTGPGGSGSSSVTVVVATLSCPTNVSYSRTDGNSNFTVGVNQNVPIRLNQQSGWPSHCEIIYLTDRGSVLRINGVIAHEVCSGGQCNWYYGGKSAVVGGVFQGTAQGISQGIIMENGRWVLNTPARFSATWTVVATALEVLGLEMPERADPWVYDPRFPGKKICLTLNCQPEK